MQSVTDLPVAQDGPPPGGFPSVRYARRVPNTGPSGALVFSAVLLGMGYGFYKTAQYNRHQNKLKVRILSVVDGAHTPGFSCRRFASRNNAASSDLLVILSLKNFFFVFYLFRVVNRSLFVQLCFQRPTGLAVGGYDLETCMVP